MASLVDTNVLVYRFDRRFPTKQRVARDLLRRGLEDDSVRVPHQSIVEFVAATTRSTGGYQVLTLAEACWEAEGFLNQFEVLYPTDGLVRLAVRGVATYALSWFDAHIWAYAEFYGLPEILSEDFQHGRLYGTVRSVNPFL